MFLSYRASTTTPAWGTSSPQAPGASMTRGCGRPTPPSIPHGCTRTSPRTAARRGRTARRRMPASRIEREIVGFEGIEVSCVYVERLKWWAGRLPRASCRAQAGNEKRATDARPAHAAGGCRRRVTRTLDRLPRTSIGTRLPGRALYGPRGRMSRGNRARLWTRCSVSPPEPRTRQKLHEARLTSGPRRVEGHGAPDCTPLARARVLP